MTPAPETGHLLARIVASSTDAVIVADEAGGIVLASSAVTSLFGYVPEELVGEPLEILLPSELRTIHVEHRKRFVTAPSPRQMGAGLRLSGQHRDGAQLPVDVSLTPVEVAGRTYVAAFVRDAREHRRTVAQLEAVSEITRRLLQGSAVSDILPVVAAHGRTLFEASLALLVAPTASGRLRVAAADGRRAEAFVGIEFDESSSRIGLTLRSGEADTLDDVGVDLSQATGLGRGIEALELGPGLHVPLLGVGERRVGVLTLARPRGGDGFQELDVSLAQLFASAAGVAMGLGESREELDRVRIATQGERIAVELHEKVIHRLFQAGMELQGVRRLLEAPLIDPIDAVVRELDEAIRDMRDTVFRLTEQTVHTDLARRVLDVAAASTPELGFTPTIHLEGPIHQAVPADIASNVVAVVREALSNVARHARANGAVVALRLADDQMALVITDDGAGYDDSVPWRSLSRIDHAARQRGGRLTIEPASPTGTVVRWSVPL